MPFADARRAERDLDYCFRLLARGSRSFRAASLLLPRSVRRDIAPIYGFCRVADDAVDGADGSLESVARLRYRLDLVYAGTPDADPVDRALSHVVARHEIPRAPFDALLEGFEWEFDGRRLETIDDVFAYSVRVAGAVGVLVTLVMGRPDAPTLARACDLGVAMQLTNIARDVGEDAARRRLYLPRGWMREVGIDPDAWLASPTFTPGIAAVVRHVLETASGLYRRAEPGIAALPAACRPAIWAARFIYADIGSVIARAGHNSVDRRAVTSPARKLAAATKALAAAFRHDGRAASDGAPLPQAGFLVAPGAAATG